MSVVNKNYSVFYRVNSRMKDTPVISEILKRKDVYNMNSSFWVFTDFFDTKAQALKFSKEITEYCNEIIVMKVYHEYSKTY